jgi:uncharacterized protein (TIGR00266 family)
MKNWHYADGSGAVHVVAHGQVASLIESGVVREQTLVWSEGMKGWVPALEAFEELFSDLDRGAQPPPLPSRISGAAGAGRLKSHEVDYEIHGDDMQLVEVELDPGERVIAEAGAMCYMEEEIAFEAKMGDGAEAGGFLGSLISIGKRVLTGESLFMTHFTHGGGSGKRRVAFAAPYPGKIVPLRLSEYGGDVLCEKGAFLCAAFGTNVSIAFSQRFGAGLFGGEGFILQRLRGDGMAFIHAGGTIVRRELEGETLRVDTGCLVAMTAGVDYSIERAGGLKSMIFGGEGMFLATLRGRGTVWIQSLPFSRMADRVLANAPSEGGRATGEGSVLGGLGRILDGD